MRVAMILAAALLGACSGADLDDVFAHHEAQLDQCLTYRLQAEAKDASATKAEGNTLGGSAARLEAQSNRSLAHTMRKTHEACLVRLLEAATATAEQEGLSADELRARWPAWYDRQAADRRGSQ